MSTITLVRSCPITEDREGCESEIERFQRDEVPAKLKDYTCEFKESGDNYVAVCKGTPIGESTRGRGSGGDGQVAEWKFPVGVGAGYARIKGEGNGENDWILGLSAGLQYTKGRGDDMVASAGADLLAHVGGEGAAILLAPVYYRDLPWSFGILGLRPFGGVAVTEGRPVVGGEFSWSAAFGDFDDDLSLLGLTVGVERTLEEEGGKTDRVYTELALSFF